MAIQTSTGLLGVFPLGSRLNERQRVEVGGCDLIELAAEYGTPAYVVAEDDLRARARAFMTAAHDAPGAPMSVVFASKAFPCIAVLELFAQEGLWCDVASGGELYLALRAGFAPERIVFHGNAKSRAELQAGLDAGVGLIVIDNFDEIDRLQALVADRTDAPQEVLIRVTPDVRGDTHAKISTGQANSKFGFSLADVPAALERIAAIAGLSLTGIHAHIGSQLLELEPFAAAAEQLGRLGRFATWDLGGGLGVAYTSQQRPPTIQQYVDAIASSARDHLGEHDRLLIEPGRALTASGAVTIYTVEAVKHNVSTWVSVDGGMSDNLRPMLYGATYEAHVADRVGGSTECVLAGKHCESGDVIVPSAMLDDPRAGDVVVTPVTGAYTYAMANNYNGVPRAPVIFCSGGLARVVERRETFEDLAARSVS